VEYGKVCSLRIGEHMDSNVMPLCLGCCSALGFDSKVVHRKEEMYVLGGPCHGEREWPRPSCWAM
jgi:hypothetical protein